MARESMEQVRLQRDEALAQLQEAEAENIRLQTLMSVVKTALEQAEKRPANG